MIALDGLPFSVFVTSKDLRKCLNALGHEIPLSAETIKIKVCRYADTFREKVLRELQMEKEKGKHFNLTLDEWTLIRSKRYLNINIHSRTKVWNLGLTRISGVFSSEQCKYVIGAKLLEFGIDFETDIECVTTDGCAMMVKLEQERDSKKEHPYSQGCFPFKIMRFVLSKLQMAYIVLFLLMVWGTLWGITEAEALPGGNLFSLFVLLISCYLAGRLMTLISLPPLLGMLLMGCFLRNVPYVNFAQNIDPKWASALRLTALVVILTRAGLGLDPTVLRQLSRTCLQLAFIPCLVEALVLALASHLLLDLPIKWALLAGFMVGAVSPAVVVSLMIHLQEEGYGVEKGIPVLVIASSSIDDILAITAFGIAYSVIFATGGSITWIAFKGPLEAVLGILYGTIMGTSFWFIPHEKGGTVLHVVMLFGAATCVTFVSPLLELGSVGPLGTLTTAFVAALRWRRQGCVEFPAKVFAIFWVVFEPFLFGLIGAEVDFSIINFSYIGILSACLAVGLIMRLGASTIAVSCAGFTLSEILFIALAWVPKATVQAALGPIALDEVRRQGLGEPVKGYALQDNEKLHKNTAVANSPTAAQKRKTGTVQETEVGRNFQNLPGSTPAVLTLAVLSIVVTAPLGALAINIAGHRFLKRKLPFLFSRLPKFEQRKRSSSVSHHLIQQELQRESLKAYFTEEHFSFIFQPHT
ncbi:SLC9B2 [Cordylochernes scorpioides]|uniref:SLC9B2 n=1 Tax=Cordylochernes scorpioides TaxID=51811 RepID=A0ABY6L5W8_9ARAC|nr:SLC9B2 [Cordylochernes scorpioides]